MANVTGTDYAEAIAALTAAVADLNVGNVFDRRRFVSSKADFAKRFGQLIDGRREIKFVEFEFVQFADDPAEGHDKCPILNVTLNLHFFQEFADERSDGSNSAIDFVDGILKIRDYFLTAAPITLPGGRVIEWEPLTQPEFAEFGADTFTDCKGHFANLSLLISFYAV